MQPRFAMAHDGQAIQQQDIETLGNAAKADDSVYATVYHASGVIRLTSELLIESTGSGNNSVIVRPFRAIFHDDGVSYSGSLDEEVTVLQPSFGAIGSVYFSTIYAKIELDTEVSSVTRKVKDTTSNIVTPVSVPSAYVHTVTVGVVTGIASLTRPALPANTSTEKYLLLGYVAIANGSSGSSTISQENIQIAATLLQESPCEPANQTPLQWNSDGTRSPVFIPSCMSGSHSLFFAIDLTTGSESHADGATLDSRDWFGRISKAVTQFWTPSSNFPWEYAGSVGIHPTSGDAIVQLGNSIFNPVGDPPVVYLSYATLGGSLGVGSVIRIYVDTATGALKLSYSDAPNVKLFVWIEFTGRIDTA